jgi:gas vesicle protein
MNGDKQCAGGSTLFSFLLGGVFGAAITLLLAPTSGLEARRRIQEFGDDLKDRADDLVSDAKDKVTYAVEKGKDLVEGKKGIIGAAVEAGKEAYDKEKEKSSSGD